MVKVHTFTCELRRAGPEVRWGLRLLGGADLSTPLIVAAVQDGSPAARSLRRGDLIAQVEAYDARDLSHRDALQLFRDARNSIKLVVHRGGSNTWLYAGGGRACFSPRPLSPAAGSSRPLTPASGFVTPSPAPTNHHRPEQSGEPCIPEGRLWVETPLPSVSARSTPLPYTSLRGTPAPSTPLPSTPLLGTSLLSTPSPRPPSDAPEEAISSQPYRTTPLVLAGAKVRREPGPCESYLRVHPNPAMRAPPQHNNSRAASRVAEAVLQRAQAHVHTIPIQRAYNSPTGAYSDSSADRAPSAQSAPLSPPQGPQKYSNHTYDPSASETWRALQIDGAVGDDPTPAKPAPPAVSNVYQPHLHKKPVPHEVAPRTVQTRMDKTTFMSSAHNETMETIQQSSSFKRLMHHVMIDSI